MKTAHMIRNSLLTGVCIGLLTGCSWLEDWPPKGSELAAKTAPKPPESRIEQTAEGNAWPQTNNRIAKAEPKGLAIDEGALARIAALEEEIAGIRNDLQLMMPALTKLAEAQGDIQQMLGQVEPAAGNSAKVVPGAANNNMYGQNYNQAPTPIAQQQQSQPRQQPQYPQQQTQQPAVQNTQNNQNTGPAPGSVAWYEQQEQQSRQQQANNAYQPPAQQQQPQATFQQASYNSAASGPVVTNIRFGEHPDKTRMVFDTSNPVSFSYNIGNNGKLLSISLDKAGWQGANQMMFNNSPLVASYNVVPDGNGGQQVTLQMRKPVKVLWAQALKPGGPQGHRIVFDLAPL